MITPIGLSIGTSTGRMERTGATSVAMCEWKIGTSRVPGVARGVPVAVQLDVDDVRLVQAGLRVLVLVVRDLDRDGRVLRVGRVL